MVKKRNAAVEPTAATPVQTRESLQRISYLMQASVLLRSLVSPELGADTQTRSDRHDGPAAMTAVQLAAIEGARDDAPLASANTTTRSAVEPPPGKERRRKRPRRASTQALERVSDHLASQMSSVAKKATVRMRVAGHLPARPEQWTALTRECVCAQGSDLEASRLQVLRRGAHPGLDVDSPCQA